MDINTIYTDEENYPEDVIRRHYKGEVTRLKKKSRVSDLYNQFLKLSQIEKDNFINQLTNYLRK